MTDRTAHEALWATVVDEPLPALLLTHAALEAYIDHLGSHLAPEVWADERARFSAIPYRGTLGKLTWLCERLNVRQDWGVEPWQSLKALDSWRNRVVHGAAEPEDLAPDSARAEAWREAVRDVSGRLHAATGERGAGPFEAAE